MTFSNGVPVYVTAHALWRYAERLARSAFEDEIISDVRAALAAGRVTTERTTVGLSPGSDPTCLYVWTVAGEPIYALRHDLRPERFVVTTTMTRRYHG